MKQKNPWVYLLLMFIPLGIMAGCIFLCNLTGKLMLFGIVAFIMVLPAMVCFTEFIDGLRSRRGKKEE